jgi:hypothetical protein
MPTPMPTTPMTPPPTEDMVVDTGYGYGFGED